MVRSTIMRSGFSSTLARPSVPFSARITAWPRRVRISWYSSRIIRSSSMTRILATNLSTRPCFRRPGTLWRFLRRRLLRLRRDQERCLGCIAHQRPHLGQYFWRHLLCDRPQHVGGFVGIVFEPRPGDVDLLPLCRAELLRRLPHRTDPVAEHPDVDLVVEDLLLRISPERVDPLRVLEDGERCGAIASTQSWHETEGYARSHRRICSWSATAPTGGAPITHSAGCRMTASLCRPPNPPCEPIC